MYSQVNEKHLTDRLSVADILSSMANGADESSSVTCSSIDGLTCGIPTRTTPTLTPTTLKNIEESFMELSSIPPAPLEHQHQAGFAPPVVSFSCLPKQEESRWVDDCLHSSDRSLDSPRPSSESSVTSRPSKTGRSGGRRPLKDEKLSPEEEERRRIRRERNKLAAARCRRRRMELTSNLMNEIDGLDEKWHNLQTEIQQLQAQKEKMEFILEAHKATCMLASSQQHINAVETEGLEEKRHTLQTEIQHLQAQKDQLEFILEAHKATCKLTSNQQHNYTSKLKSNEDRLINRLKYARPNSLSLSSSFNSDSPLKSSSPSLSAINEINSSLNTPSAGLFHFDSVMDEPTTSSSNIPCVISSCSGQQRSSSSDLSSPDSIAPPKLVSL